MLLVRAYNKADNTRARHIRNGTSEQFVVGPCLHLSCSLNLGLRQGTLFCRDLLIDSHHGLDVSPYRFMQRGFVRKVAALLFGVFSNQSAATVPHGVSEVTRSTNAPKSGCQKVCTEMAARLVQ